MLKNGFFIVLITSLLLILLVGCRTGVDNNFAPPEYVYLPEIIPFPTCPDGLEVIDKVAVTDDLVFFSAMFFGDVHGVIRTDLLFSMEIDGTNPELLPNYRPNRPKRTFSSGTISISSMHIDSGGNLWVVESGYFILFGSYANIAENEDIPSIPVLDSFGTCIIRKLDNCGEELMSIDISDILAFDARGFRLSFV